MVQFVGPDGDVFEGVNGINPSGQMIVGGYYSDGSANGPRGFLLTPVPEPSTLGLLITFALILLVICYRFRRRAENGVAGKPVPDCNFGAALNRP
jgi:hypothetical protein